MSQGEDAGEVAGEESLRRGRKINQRAVNYVVQCVFFGVEIIVKSSLDWTVLGHSFGTRNWASLSTPNLTRLWPHGPGLNIWRIQLLCDRGGRWIIVNLDGWDWNLGTNFNKQYNVIVFLHVLLVFKLATLVCTIFASASTLW